MPMKHVPKGAVPRMVVRERQTVVEEPLMKPSEVKVVITYMKGNREVTEAVTVPKVLFDVIANPGESQLKPLDAMRALTDFYEKIVRPELKELIIKGGISIPAAVISTQIQYAYAAHAVIAGTEKDITSSLMLEHPQVSRILRTAAALLSGVSEEQIQKLDLDETTVWVSRSITTLKKTPQIKMEIKRLECDCGSHREEREFSVPSGTSVSEAKSIQEQRLKRLPDVKRELDRTYEKIEELRGKPLSKDEKNAVVAHMNVTYLKDAKDRLVVTP